jgi:hypothetical protein
MIGLTEPLTRNFQRLETVWFECRVDGGMIALRGEITVFRDMRDNSGVVCARLEDPAMLISFYALRHFTDYPCAIDNMRSQLSSQCDSLTLDYEAESSLTPSR